MRRWTLTIAACSWRCPASAAIAQDYPNRTITLVVPLPPGGTNDILARAIADKLSAGLGQQVVVENRPVGGSGTVASRAVVRGPADGYTLLLAYTTTVATAPSMLPNVGYDAAQGLRAGRADRVGARAAAGASERDLQERSAS